MAIYPLDKGFCVLIIKCYNAVVSLLDTLEIEKRPIRQSRHTFASMMLSQNEDILWVSKMMGHTDKSLTLNIYSKYVRQKRIKRGEFSETLSI